MLDPVSITAIHIGDVPKCMTNVVSGLISNVNKYLLNEIVGSELITHRL